TETAYAHALVDQSSHAVQMLELAAQHERQELNRFEKLASEKTVEEQRLDTQRFVAKSRELELGKVKSELQSAQAALARVRSTVGLPSAQANLNVAEAQLELTTIRAPIDGEILKILTYPGERIGNDPILKMGDTTNMYVVAEVEENDVAAVHVGQRATITSEAVNEPLQGTVEEIGRLIYKNDIFNLDPRANRDTRIGEARTNAIAVYDMLDFDVAVVSPECMYLGQLGDFPRHRFEEIRSIDGVESLSPLWLQVGRWRNSDTREDWDMLAIAVEPSERP